MGKKEGKTVLWAWVDEDVKSYVEKLAKIQGISMSNYVRSLIIKDLDERGFFQISSRRETE